MKSKYLSIFSGVGVAVVTPFDENNNIDEKFRASIISFIFLYIVIFFS